MAWLQTVGAAAGVVASLVGPRISNRFGIGPTKLVTGALLVPVVIIVPVAEHLPGPAAMWLAVNSGLWAFLIVVYSIAGAGVTAQLTPRHLLSRVSSSARVATLGVMPLASIAAGLLADALGTGPVLWCSALLAAFSVLPILTNPLRSWRELPPEHIAASRSGAAN